MELCNMWGLRKWREVGLQAVVSEFRAQHLPHHLDPIFVAHVHRARGQYLPHCPDAIFVLHVPLSRVFWAG